MIVKVVTEPMEKERIARSILEALPDWFGILESRETYIRECACQLFYAAYDEELPIGFIYLKETGRDTSELAVAGVLKEYHRRGIGRELFLKAKEAAAEKGYSFLQVKTVKMGVYENYDNTNRFYLALGFRSLFSISPRTSGLHLFRHILPKSSLIHKVLPAVLASSGEKSDCAIRTRGDTEQALRNLRYCHRCGMRTIHARYM